MELLLISKMTRDAWPCVAVCIHDTNRAPNCVTFSLRRVTQKRQAAAATTTAPSDEKVAARIRRALLFTSCREVVAAPCVGEGVEGGCEAATSCTAAADGRGFIIHGERVGTGALRLDP